MLLRALKKFREHVEEEYQREEEKNMEQWKKDVMELHEKSEFLFYFDDADTVTGDNFCFLVKGNQVKGELPLKSLLYLYSGEGKLLGEGLLMSSPEEKEDIRRGLLKRKKNEFLLKVTALLGEESTALSEKEFRRRLRILFTDLSLISDKQFLFKEEKTAVVSIRYE